MSKYTDNYEKIFGDPKPQKGGSWVIDPVTKKLVPRAEFTRPTQAVHAVHGDIEAFRSPIDGTIIDDRGKLREHNKRHGVTNIADYGPEYFERCHKQRSETMQGTSQATRQQRRKTILNAIEKHS